MNDSVWLTGTGCSKECYGFRGPPFPQKLFAAMDAPRAVIQWSNNGQAICVDAEVYERSVMLVHPGLVEISSFANFRRQMREYGFDWLYHPETREFEFSHPSFVRGRPDLLSAVLTRRKRRRKPSGTSSFGTSPRSAPLPCRRSVISYAGRDGDRASTCRLSMHQRDVGSSKSLSEITDDEWWTYCAPAIMSGVNAVNDDAVGRACPPIENRFTFPLFFYCDESTENTDQAATRIPTYGPWTQRVLDFDEL